MAKQRLSTEVRRQQIVKAALALLADISLEKLTTRQVATSVGLSQPALFRHFSSRDQLLGAVADHVRDELGQIVEALLADALAPVEMLRQLLMSLLDYVERHPGLPRILFAEATAGSGELHATLRHLVSMQRTFVEHVVGLGQRGGTIRSDLDRIDAATLFVAIVQGEVFMWQLEGRTRSLTARGARVFDLWLHGVGAEKGGECLAPSEPPVARPPGVYLFDVRPMIAAGQDPLEQLIAEIETLGTGSVFLVRAPFLPKPLLTLLRSQGHGVEAEEIVDGVFVVSVWIGRADPVIDLRDLEPPEPLEAILKASTCLEAGQTYLARLPRFPRLLLPHLDKRPVRVHIEDLEDDSVLIWLEGAE